MKSVLAGEAGGSSCYLVLSACLVAELDVTPEFSSIQGWLAAHCGWALQRQDTRDMGQRGAEGGLGLCRQEVWEEEVVLLEGVSLLCSFSATVSSG